MKQRSSYTIYVTFDQMCEFDSCNLIIATCNSLDRLDDWLLPAARQFLKEKCFGNEDERKKRTWLSFSGFPASMEKLEDYILSHGPLVQYVSVSVDKHRILAPTVSGRSLIEMLLDALAENHLNKFSWGGRYSSRDIVIIDYGRGAKHMKILQEAVPEASKDAMVKDLRTAAKLFMPHYMEDNIFPVFFDDLKQKLETPTTKCIGEKWFMDSLSYHPALMHSSGRRCFHAMLHNIYNKHRRKGSTDLDIMKMIHPAYPVNWKEWVTYAKKNGNAFLDKVYNYEPPNEKNTDRYGVTVGELMRFIRNVFQHGEKVEGQCEECLADLELFTAKTFCKLLPSVLRTLLKEGLTQNYFREAWELYRASRSDKTDPWSNRSHLRTDSKGKRPCFVWQL
uniref:Uncharacterized protein n=1 Tax=Avena sativa TaxID=4498 RepID=A0ACD5X7A2_AVESA